SLSCALVHHPDVLLLDEPTFGVDPISRRDLWLILHQMVADGTTVIVTTSYMDEAERCDRVALLHDGRLIACDAPATIQSRLGRRLLEVRSADPRALRDALRRHPEVAHATLFGDAVHVVLRRQHDAAVLDGIQADRIAPVQPSLEDAFIELVGGGS